MDNNDYELKVLRAFLTEEGSQALIRSTVPSVHFLNERHRDVFDEAVKYLDQYELVPTQEILKDLLRKLRPMEGSAYDVLCDRLWAPDESEDLQHLPFYIRSLDENWRSDQAQKKMRVAIDKLKDRDVSGALNVLHQEVPQPYAERIVGDVSGDLFTVVEEAKERAAKPHLYAGIPIGFPSIDIATQGHGRGELVVVIGGTGVGKSLVLGQIAINVARTQKKVLLVTVENNKRSYMNRLYSNLSKVPYYKFKGNQLDDVDMATWFEAMAELPENFYLKVVEFPEGCSARDIWAYMRTLPEKVDYLVVDQITNMFPNDPKSFTPMSWQFFGQISLDLKRLAGYAYNNEGIPVLSAAQAAGGTVGKKTLTTDDVAMGKIILHHAHGGLYVTREEEEYTMGSSKYRDAHVKPFAVFPEFKYWSVSEHASLSGFGAPAPSGGSAIQYDAPAAPPPPPATPPPPPSTSTDPL